MVLLLKTDVTCESMLGELSQVIFFNCCFHCFGLFYNGLKERTLAVLLNAVFGLMCFATLCLAYNGPHFDCELQSLSPTGDKIKTLLTMLILMQNNAVQWLLLKS